MLETLALAAPAGTFILDAPVSGTAEDIAAGRLTVLVGGPAADVDRVRPVLDAYASTVIATGSIGTALRMKLVNNLLFAANAQFVANAVDLAARSGATPVALFEVLAAGSGASGAAQYMCRLGGIDRFTELAAPFLSKDLAACDREAASSGLDLGLLRRVADTGPLDLALRATATDTAGVMT